MKGLFEEKVYCKLQELYPTSIIEENKSVNFGNLRLEIDFIINFNNKRYAIECKNLVKKQINKLSKSIARLILIKKSGYFDKVILITSLDLAKFRTRKYLKNGITPLIIENLDSLETYKNPVHDDNFINKVLNKHNLSERQLAILIGLKSKKQIYDYKKNGIPNRLTYKLKNLFLEKNSRQLHFKSFLNSIKPRKFFYRLIRENLNLSQKEFAKELNIPTWTYVSFEKGFEDQKYLYDLIEKNIKNICLGFNKNYDKIKNKALFQLKHILKMIEKARCIPEIIGFNFPSSLSLGRDYKSNIKKFLVDRYPNSLIVNNAIIANKNVSQKYEVDFLVYNFNKLILVECKKNISNEGRNIGNYISSIIERRELLNFPESLLISDSKPTENEMQRFNNSGITFLSQGPIV
ncbi:MAG: helix-turn-helix transcriptional regulator [Nanoarchaeota archaeon]